MFGMHRETAVAAIEFRQFDLRETIQNHNNKQRSKKPILVESTRGFFAVSCVSRTGLLKEK
jgi:hypothetical protein